jgi:8-oxo-dGTP pyrophosphatase MutT (NUDIX family)
MGFKMRVRSAAILIHEDKILLTEFGGGKYYNFTGGGIEENETAKQAVAREVMEESGLTVDVGELVFTLEYEPKSCGYYYGDSPSVSLFFRCYLDTGIPPQVPSHPDVSPDDPAITSIAKWIPLSELERIPFIPPIYESLMRYLETGVFTPSFWESNIHEQLGL